MREVEIHNGQIIEPEDYPVKTEQAPAGAQSKAKSEIADSSLDPEFIAAAMAKTLSTLQGLSPPATPMAQVNALLQLRGPGGKKLVWTRLDVMKAFALWQEKATGQGPSPGSAP